MREEINFKNVSWTPAKMGGAMFQTSVFRVKNENSLVISPSTMFKILVPIVILILSFLPFLFSIINSEKPSLIIILVVICFDAIMLIVYLQGLKLIEINKQTDSIKQGLSLQTAKSLKKISEIQFIQIVEQLIPQKRNYYYSYEINLVYNDDTRFNLVDHSELNIIQRDARLLKQFIEKPIYTINSQTNEIKEFN
jgi:hypothetical protein